MTPIERSTAALSLPVLGCNPDNDADDCGPAETPACSPKYCGPDGAVTGSTRFLWLELTTKCQLACRHCYNHSSPAGDHGTMTFADWCAVIDQATAEGVKMIQFIGGEPTMHPDLPPLIHHALDGGLEVEVYTNLVWVPEMVWDVFGCDGVRLATSWYTDDPDQHQQITGRPTYGRTKANILRALGWSIPLRVGLVGGILPGQRVEQARAQLHRWGVTDVRLDTVRALGRASVTPDVGDVSQLCGRCGHGIAAVLADGSMAPCPMSRWLAEGDVRTGDVAAMLSRTAALVPERPRAKCDPAATDGCSPPCEPQCNPGCDPSVDED
jgi:hypothetical protein